MNERPILFSAPMVRALLAGTKTQTRRVMKLHPSAIACCCGGSAAKWKATNDGQWHCGICGGGNRLTSKDVEGVRCPYGAPGDRLWVREAFAFTDAHEPDYSGSIEYRADNKCLAIEAGRVLVDVPHGCDPRAFAGPWRPSIHMPRWACRLVLEITCVRVERLQDISEADAQAEGSGLTSGSYSHRGWFRELWGEINRPAAWDANPWVWVVGFRRLEAS